MARPQPQTLDAETPQINADWGLELSQPATQQALAYWRLLCGERTMPRRDELSPRGMRAFLSYVNLVDIVAAPLRGAVDYIVRLQGHHASEVHGHVANRRLAEVLPPQSEQRWRFCFDMVREAARPARFWSRIGGKQWLSGELLVAPLGNERGEVESLFCVLVSWSAKPESH